MAALINGKEVSAKVRESVRLETEEFKKRTGVTPGLAVILVGDDPASKIYVGNKKKACLEEGFNSFEHILPESTTETELLELIKKLNADLMPAPASEAHKRARRYRGNFPRKGRRRVPPAERRQNNDRQLQIPALHPRGDNGAYSLHRHIGKR